MTRTILLHLLILVAAVAAAGQTGTSGSDQSNLIHLGDIIDVDVVGSFEYDWRGTISPEGYLDGMDKVEEPIYALCRSENEVADLVSTAYSKILRDPKIIVRIVDKSNRAAAYIEGAVKTPQKFQIKRPVRLTEILVLAGGITENSNGEVRIFRPPNLSCAAGANTTRETSENSAAKTPETIAAKIADILRGATNANPLIRSGDIISVSEALPVYVMGGVKFPKQVSSRTSTTLARAIASAGGVSKKGLENEIIIYRRENGNTRTIRADLAKINARQSEDILLRPYDIVEVGQKNSIKRQFAPVIATSGFQSSKTLGLPLRIID